MHQWMPLGLLFILKETSWSFPYLHGGHYWVLLVTGFAIAADLFKPFLFGDCSLLAVLEAKITYYLGVGGNKGPVYIR
jgi:hypothetical protein